MENSRTPYDELLTIIREKHEMVPQLLDELGIECWLVFLRETSASPDPVQPLVIGGDVVWESAFIFTQDVRIAIVGDFDADAEREKGIWTEVVPYTQGISTPLVKSLEGVQTIAVNYSKDDVMADGLSHGLYEKLCEYLPDKHLISSQHLVSKLRSRKSRTEIRLLTEACLITEQINEVVGSMLNPGLTEKEIQQMFHEEMDRRGVTESWQRKSCPAVDTGPDKVMGHVGPTDLRLREGHTLHNDFGVRYHGYCSDIQRMWFVGTDIPEELIHAFETVRDAIYLASEFIKPGVRGHEVDSVARNYVVSRGYEEYKHALGHQVGTLAHDGGTLLGPLWERYGDLPNGVVEEGNVFTLELYVTTKNYGMVSLEEMVEITAEGCRFLVPRQESFLTVTTG